jgi:hypothetical protein
MNYRDRITIEPSERGTSAASWGLRRLEVWLSPATLDAIDALRSVADEFGTVVAVAVERLASAADSR